jgi:surface protein
MRSLTYRRALAALSWVMLTVLLGILGWRGLSYAEGLVEGENYGVVSTIADPAIAVSVPTQAQLTLTRAEAQEGAAPYYLSYAGATGEVANVTQAETAEATHDATVRITLNQGQFDLTAVTSHFAPASAAYAEKPLEVALSTWADLAPGTSATATFEQENLASLGTTSEAVFNAGATSELARLEDALGVDYPQAANALDEIAYSLAYVDFPLATVVSVLTEDGTAPGAVEPGTALYARLENVPTSAEALVSWWTQDAAGNLLEQVGEGLVFTPETTYDRLVAVLVDATEKYLGERASDPVVVTYPGPYAVYFEADALVEFYAGLEIPKVGDIIDGKAVTLVDATIQELDAFASVRSCVQTVRVVDPFEFPGTSLANYFKGYEACETFDLERLATPGVTTFASMFEGCKAVAALDLTSFTTSAATSLEAMFKGCSALVTVEVAGFNTAAVTTLANLFEGCAALTSLDLTSWNTAAVTSFARLFSGAASLEAVSLITWDTSSGVTFEGMFEGCAALASLDLANFSTAAATNFTSMFKGCVALTELDLASFETAGVTTMASMFEGDGALATIYATDELWTNTRAVNSTSVFAGCDALVGGNGTAYAASSVGGGRALVDRAGQVGYLTDATIPSKTFAVYSATDNSVTLYNARVLPKVGATYKGRVVTALDSSIEALDELEAWREDTKILRVSEKLVFPASSMEGYFAGYVNVTTADLLGLDIQNVDNLDRLFYGCASLTQLNLRNFMLDHAVSMEATFEGCSSLKTIYASEDNWDPAQITASANTFAGCTKLVGGNGTRFDAALPNSDYALIDGSLINDVITPGYLTDAPLVTFAVYSDTDASVRIYARRTVPSVGQELDGRRVTAVDETIEQLDALTAYKTKATSVEVVDKVTFPATMLATWLSGWTALKTATLDNLYGEDVTSLYRMFYGCTALTTATFANLDTASVTTLAQMFYLCEALTTVDLTSFDTSSVTTMSCMFRECRSLVTLNLTSFDTHNVSIMEYLFYNCTSLTTVYGTLDRWDSSKVPIGYEMFYNCERLVGGMGTSYVYKHRQVGRAHIDRMGQQGYLTDPTLETGAFAVYTEKDATVRLYAGGSIPVPGQEFNGQIVTAVDGTLNALDAMSGYKDVIKHVEAAEELKLPTTTLYQYFYGWTGLESVDLTKLDVSEITSFQYAFACCSNLVDVNLSGWDTSSVTNMAFMFWKCYALPSIDLTGFNTSKVTTMRSLFSYCTSLVEANITTFSTERLTNINYLFYCDSALVTVYASDSLWSISGIKEGITPFYQCNKIRGGRGTTFKTNEYIYAVVDKLGQKGYFTDPARDEAANLDSFAVYTASDKTLRFYAGKDVPAIGDYYRGLKVTATDSTIEELDNLTSYTTAIQYVEVVDTITFPGDTLANYFSGWTALKTVDVTKLDVSHVTSFSYFLASCTSLKSVDLSGWNTGAATDFTFMFWKSTALTTVCLAGMNTSSATTMRSMFSYCSSLTSVNLTGIDTSKVTSMLYMFYQCLVLPELDLSGFSLAKLSDSRYMFYGDAKLTTIYADENWNVSKVSSSTSMFEGCSSLVGGYGAVNTTTTYDKTWAYIDSYTQAGLLTSKNRESSYPFAVLYGDYSVVFYENGELPRPGEKHNSKTVLTIDGTIASLDAFESYKSKMVSVSVHASATSIPLPASAGANYFYEWTALKTVSLAKFDVSKVTTLSYAFASCTSLTSVDLTGWNTSAVKDMSFMFWKSTALTTVKMGGLNTSKVTTMRSMFSYCSALTSVDIVGLNTSSVTTMLYMFYQCSALTKLDLCGISLAKVTTTGYMFSGCTKLTTIYVNSSWSVTNVSESAYMFQSCSNLVGGNGFKNTTTTYNKTWAVINTSTVNGLLTACTNTHTASAALGDDVPVAAMEDAGTCAEAVAGVEAVLAPCVDAAEKNLEDASSPSEEAAQQGSEEFAPTLDESAEVEASRANSQLDPNEILDQESSASAEAGGVARSAGVPATVELANVDDAAAAQDPEVEDANNSEPLALTHLAGGAALLPAGMLFALRRRPAA